MSSTSGTGRRDELLAYRRHFHAHPELSLKEFETAAFIERELRERSFDEIRTGVGKTGILATLRGGKPGPVTLLRADMDALPIAGTQRRAVPLDECAASMHACGHDGHMAILLAARGAGSRGAPRSPARSSSAFSPARKGMPGTS